MPYFCNKTARIRGYTPKGYRLDSDCRRYKINFAEIPDENIENWRYYLFDTKKKKVLKRSFPHKYLQATSTWVDPDPEDFMKPNKTDFEDLEKYYNRYGLTIHQT